MSFYTKIAFRLFGAFSDELSIFFPDLPDDIKRAGMQISTKEYISICMMTAFLVLLAELPALSFVFGFFFKSAVISVLTAITVSIVLAIFIFYLFTKYPKTVIAERSKKIDAIIPFASLFLSTVTATKLPLDKTFKIFGEHSNYGEITRQVRIMNSDVEIFGLDINTALKRAVDRSPSKKLKELFWGILSTSISGGDISRYLREKAETQMDDYKRTINEFSQKITFFIEIYLTAIVIGAIFFIILTSLFSGIANLGAGILVLQSLIIFVFLPLVSIIFILLIKMSTPAGE